MTNPRAGQPAAPTDLVNVAKLVTAYYAVHPIPVTQPSGYRLATPVTGDRRSTRITSSPYASDLRLPGQPRH